MLAVLVYGMIEGLLIALVALAFQLNYNGLKLFDISIGAIYVVASYLLIGFASIFDSLLISLSLSIIGIVLIALIIEFFIYRPFIKKNTSSLVMLLISLSIYAIIINSVVLLAGVESKSISLFENIDFQIEFFGVILTLIQLVQIVFSIFSILIVYLILSKTILGKKITAISENLTLFRIMGLNENKVRQIILIISSILIAISSILRTSDVGISPFGSGFHIVLLAAIAVIIGGITSPLGVIIGSILLGLIINLAAWFFSGEWKEAATFLLLVFVLIVKKDGLVHTSLRTEE
jgi:branched-chain amino acid transport system permease protein